MTDDPTRDLIAFALDLAWGQVSRQSQQVLHLSLLDWLAVGRAGRDEPVSQTLRALGLSEAGNPVASVLGSDTKMPARMAALVNGTTSHALDYDDTHFLHIGHTSVVVLPAILAVGETIGASGEQVLAAALVGFESSARIGQWLGRAHYQAGFHMTATAGSFGAVLGVGRLLGLDGAAMQNAMGLVSTRASGLKAQFGTMGKPYNAGLAAANAVEAGQLAQAGMTSDNRGLLAFAQAHFGEKTDLSVVLNGLGTTFVNDWISHKFHACCHGTHATLEALAKIKPDPRVVGAVDVTVHPRWLNVCNKPAPKTGLEAKFSYKLCVAMALAGLDTGAMDSFTDANCTNAELIRLRDLVRVSGDESMADGAALVEVFCGSDRGRRARFDLVDPLPLTQRHNKVHAKAAALLGTAYKQAAGAVQGLSDAVNLADLGAIVSAE